MKFNLYPILGPICIFVDLTFSLVVMPYCDECVPCIVVPTKSDSDVMLCLQCYQGLIVDSRWLKWSVYVSDLLSNCKQSITSLSLLVGTTVDPLAKMTCTISTCSYNKFHQASFYPGILFSQQFDNICYHRKCNVFAMAK